MNTLFLRTSPPFRILNTTKNTRFQNSNFSFQHPPKYVKFYIFPPQTTSSPPKSYPQATPPLLLSKR